MNDETFELCREVYEATKWYDTEFHYRPHKNSDGAVNYIPQYRMGNYQSTLGEVIPQYDSDYLLERLPNDIILKKTEDGDYRAYAPKTAPIESVTGFTPLIALLRLTLELKREGIL